MHKMIGPLIFVLGLFIYGCGGGADSSASDDSTPMRVLAKNIVFKSVAGALAPRAADSSEIDMTTTVLAENVQLETTDNALNSNNLQDALNNEMAIDLSKLLPGTTWTVTNKSANSTYKGTTGQVTFSNDGTFTIDSGRFAAGGIISASENVSSCYIPTGPINYELLSNAIMYLSWTGDLPQYNTDNYPIDGIITVVAKSKDSIILVGEGGCGGQGMQRVSVLTKNQ